MGKTWRLILDQKHDGYYNMAVDEAILLGYESFRVPTLRVYGWDEPFISLGYNQNPEDILNFSQKFPFVRRITGGSAILHHKELTYSIVCSRKDLGLPQAVKASYRIICSFLKRFYSQLGVEASFANDLEFRDQKVKKGLGRYKNFCFSNWEHLDLLIAGKKIGGNAQRRRKDIIFQHGSIPQEIDPTYKARATSLEEILDKSPSFDSLRALLCASFQFTFGVEFNQEELSASEKERVSLLLNQKYRTKEWNKCKIFENAQN